MENGKWRVEKNSAFYMGLALSLARKGLGQTSPNPAVGAVLVRDGHVIGQGYHKRAGLPHAEIEVLQKAGSKARGATLYVTLEPCDHWGKTPPCTDAIMRAGIKKVIFSMKDPNPLVNGKGMTQLKRAGIGVIGGVLEDQAGKLNEAFVHQMKTGLPFVTVKIAQSLDGKIATYKNQSQWITGTSAREYAHQLRRKVDAVLVGIQTVIHDNPSLTARVNGRKIPQQLKKVILDPQLKISPTAKLFSSDSGSYQIIVTAPSLAKSSKAKTLQKKTRCEILACPIKRGQFQLRMLLKHLTERSVQHLLVEGGGETIASFFEQKLVNKVVWFIAPLIIGGRQSPTSVEGVGVKNLADSVRLGDIQLKRFDEDLCIEGYVK